MRLQRCLSIGLISACLSLSAWLASPEIAWAQGGAPTVSTVTLQVVPGPNGENVITPRGLSVPLPGAGVNSNSVQIYMGSQGGFWYIDKNGQNVDLTSYVERFRAMQGGQTAQAPQYAAPPQQPVNIYNEQGSSGSSSGSSGASALGTAAAAGLGAMAGSAISGAYYNNGYYHGVPYGTPVYYPRGGSPYYVNASGNTVNVNHSYQGAQGNTAANVQPTNVNNAHVENMQRQQEWYQNQQKQNPQQFKAWQQSAGGENPFVNQDSQGRFGRREAAQNDAEGGRGRFGRRNNDGVQGESGRFGGNQAGERSLGGGGRFGGNAGNAAAGGRFGGRRGNR